VVFFGLLSYVPKADAMIHFVQDIWARIAEAPKLRYERRPARALVGLPGRRLYGRRLCI
jgi:hypothetical protein